MHIYFTEAWIITAPTSVSFQKLCSGIFMDLKENVLCVCHYKPVHQHNQRYRQSSSIIGWVLIHHWWCSSTNMLLYKLHLCAYRDFSIPRSRTSHCCWPSGLQQRRHLQTVLWNPKQPISQAVSYSPSLDGWLLSADLNSILLPKIPLSLCLSCWYLKHGLVTSSCMGHRLNCTPGVIPIKPLLLQTG